MEEFLRPMSQFDLWMQVLCLEHGFSLVMTMPAAIGFAAGVLCGYSTCKKEIAVSRFQKLRDMTPEEVERVHRIYDQYGSDTEKVIELIADLRAYCGQAWPRMLEEALERYQHGRRGDE